MGAVLSWAHEGRGKRSRQMAMEGFRFSMAYIRPRTVRRLMLETSSPVARGSPIFWSDVPCNDKQRRNTTKPLAVR